MGAQPHPRQEPNSGNGHDRGAMVRFWIILDVTLAVPKFVAVASLCFAMVVFAIGETMLSPVGRLS